MNKSPEWSFGLQYSYHNVPGKLDSKQGPLPSTVSLYLSVIG